MATNYFIKFAGTTGNAISDSDFYSTGSYKTDGIIYQSDADSNLLNGILRQTTTVSSVIAAYLEDSDQLNVDSISFTLNRFKAAVDKQITTKQTSFNATMPFIKSEQWESGGNAQFKIWVGTETQYGALGSYNSDTLYFIL